jgi:hypothetical protein
MALLNYGHAHWILVKNPVDEIDDGLFYQTPKFGIVAILAACGADQTCKITPFYIQKVSMPVFTYI